MQFVVLMGIVSLFADMTYEGARSITGQYLALLGASGTVVGVVSGLGAQESVMRAIVANLVKSDKRATAYGIFNIWFGVFWFLGSALIGFMYDRSPR